MNKKVLKTIEKIEECSIEEVVNDFLDCYEYELLDLKDSLEYDITSYLEEEDIEYSSISSIVFITFLFIS